MKLLLLCLGLTLVCAFHEGEMDVVENFDPSKITGKWFSILLASDQKEKIEEEGSMRAFVEYIDVLKNSSLLFKFHASYHGTNVFSVADVEYEEYIIFFAKNEENFLLVELYGRQPDVRTEIKEKFVDFCAKHGIAEGNIVDMTKVEDPCLQARSDEEV
ncbi:allergen Fel d 4-like [Perognathus longimembris pacificus]|uniref:allergen Fel d 4-like n=1 Tax=Perognathus longimembris pacificus TaxID=214514 RepID=UPI002018895F|nr:allergen Fel d 4-like [Perognathus longimembris pacificus]